MTATAQRYLYQIKEIVVRHLRGQDATVYLFGSHAAGNTHRFSDVDVAIDPKTPLPGGLLGALHEALEESTVPWHVDLIDLSETGLDFRRRVVHEGVVWSG